MNTYLYMLSCLLTVHELLAMYLACVSVTSMFTIEVPRANIKRSLILKGNAFNNLLIDAPSPGTQRDSLKITRWVLEEH